MRKTTTLFLVVCFYFVPLCSYGASNNFTIRTLVGSDTTPPTTPTIVSAVPVSISQVDITWSVSTDNFILGGYQVFRNSVQIATTTLTTYSDSALTASTLYSYSVRAFDSVFNYSSTSNALATTTYAPIPTTTPPASATFGSKSGMSLQEFTIVPKQRSADFFWKTSTFAKFDLRWGRSTSYELGFVSHELLRREHTTAISDLEPSTVYQFELVGYDRFGKQFTLKRGEFKTQSAPDTTASANIANLKAYVVGDTVHLSWKNPKDIDFSRVRIMRSHLFFPIGTRDGFLSYEGAGESFADRGALADTRAQYYTVFTVDNTGNLSSGAVIAVVAGGEFVSPVVSDGATVPAYVLTFGDFEFIQNEKGMTSEGLSTADSFLVRIAYAKLPEHLKTITMTIGASEQTTSYLLRINNEKTYYEAVIPSHTYKNKEPVVFAVYDFKTKTMQSVSGVVSFYTSALREPSSLLTPFVTTLAVQSEVVTFLVFFLVFILLLCIMMMGRKLRK